VDDGLEVSKLVGKTEAEARALIERAGLRVRISGRDGEHYILTMDYWIDRVNLYIENDKVVEAKIG
jgi:hypothetical protein